LQCGVVEAGRGWRLEVLLKNANNDEDQAAGDAAEELKGTDKTGPRSEIAANSIPPMAELILHCLGAMLARPVASRSHKA
jgi:hypothetical protein